MEKTLQLYYRTRMILQERKFQLYYCGKKHIAIVLLCKKAHFNGSIVLEGIFDIELLCKKACFDFILVVENTLQLHYRARRHILIVVSY